VCPTSPHLEHLRDVVPCVWDSLRFDGVAQTVVHYKRVRYSDCNHLLAHHPHNTTSLIINGRHVVRLHWVYELVIDATLCVRVVHRMHKVIHP